MSIKKIEIREEHLKLIGQLGWSLDENDTVSGVDNDGTDNLPVFGFDSRYEAIDVILNGSDTVGLLDEETHTLIYSEEIKKEWDILYSELPMVLDVILYRGSFELGTYTTKYHLRKWKKIS